MLRTTILLTVLCSNWMRDNIRVVSSRSILSLRGNRQERLATLRLFLKISSLMFLVRIASMALKFANGLSTEMLTKFGLLFHRHSKLPNNSLSSRLSSKIMFRLSKEKFQLNLFLFLILNIRL